MALTKAQMFELSWSSQGVPIVPSTPHMTVQFNPASLKVSYSNQIQTDGNSTTSAMQSVGKGDSKLAVELVFDVSGAGAGNTLDVRQMTKHVAYFMKPAPETVSTTETAGGGQSQQRYRVPGLRFQWGTFFFDGILVSMDETLDLWSEDGRPLRATVTLNLSQPGIHVAEPTNSEATTPPTGATQGGVTPLTPAAQGSTVQNLAAQAGKPNDWKAIASQNGIENPRNLTPGTLIDLNVKARGVLRPPSPPAVPGITRTILQPGMGPP
ncbi:MAG TPA: hypothetical protein V6D20_22895 [Candidatus Obscuribacterales bacterium]